MDSMRGTLASPPSSKKHIVAWSSEENGGKSSYLAYTFLAADKPAHTDTKFLATFTIKN
jgi:hypothetical protein